MELQESISRRFNVLDTERSSILDRARRNSELTIPSVQPESGSKESDDLPKNYTSVGSSGVNSLANKLSLALLPANQPFFRFSISKNTSKEIPEESITEFNKALSEIEKEIMLEMENKSIRVPIINVLKNLIITGNGLMYIPNSDEGIRIYRLDNFVINRDAYGNILEIITKESLSLNALPEDIKQEVMSNSEDVKEEVELYTRIYLNDKKKWILKQEVSEVNIVASEGEFDFDDNPFVAVRWTAISGENYGRGLVEDILPDLNSLNLLKKAILQGARIATRILYFVRPGGVTRPNDIAKSKNGDVIKGDVNDVNLLQSQKSTDLNIRSTMANEIEGRLNKIFMSNTSVQRDAERVTAEEIRYMAQELETNLGGVYSLLSQELQLPLVKRLMKVMTKQKKIPRLPKGSIAPVITTGIGRLGRTSDANNLIGFVQTLGNLVGPEQVTQMLSSDDLAQRLATAMNIETEGLIKSKEQVSQEQEASMSRQMTKDAMPGVAKEATKRTMEQMRSE